jgi:DNA-binding transcriptional MocR family regulator
MHWQMARRAEKMNPSVIRAILKVNKLPGIISFPVGLPMPQTFPTHAVRAASERMLKDDGKADFQNAASVGHTPLLEWVAQDLLEQKRWTKDVAFVLGSAIYAQVHDESTLRLSFVTATVDQINTGMAALAAAIRESL